MRWNGFASDVSPKDTGQPAPFLRSCPCPRVPPNEVSSSAESLRCFQDCSLLGLGRGGPLPSPSPDFSSPVLSRVRITPNTCKSGAELGRGCRKYCPRFMGRQRGAVICLNPCANAPFERGWLGLAFGGGPHALCRSL